MAPPLRVLVVYGSETGTAKAGISKVVGAWQGDSTIQAVDQLQGNSVGPLPALSEKYDVILVSTSSFGEGDPPGNYGNFLAKLLKASKAGEKPLAGMQHAVLGFGSSCYDTFQNCPRLTDKMLGECGSRRVARRCEIDEMDDEAKTNTPKVKEFEAAVSKALHARTPASKPPVCEWTEPAREILEKSESDLGGFSIEDSSPLFNMAVGAAVLVVACGGAYYGGVF